jgi:phage terminase large subunit
MAQIQLNLKKSQFIPSFYPLLMDYSHRWEYYCGSAGSGKSFHICQKIIIRCCNEPIRVLVCRRYGITLRNSCFALFKEILDKWKITQYVKIKETDMSITFPNGSQIIFIGLDSEEKLLSLQNVSTIWCEESYEIEKNKIEQLNLRMRGQAQNQQLILSWNPISKQSWLFDFTVENPPESSIFHHSTYKDNPFLNAEYIAALDEMAIRNPAKYRIYGLGEWGVDVEGQVITNYRVEEFDAMELAKQGLEHRCGMDIGWRDKSAITATLYDKERHTIYVYDEFYKSGCQQSDLAKAIKEMGLAKSRIKVDAAEPRMIHFFRSEGINAEGCAKGRDSVKAGYMFLQDNLIIVHPKCKNLIVEFENLCYAKSKLTGEYTEEFNDHTYTHACDSVRYAYSDIYTNKQLKTINKASLGL